MHKLDVLHAHVQCSWLAVNDRELRAVLHDEMRDNAVLVRETQFSNKTTIDVICMVKPGSKELLIN